MTTQHVIHFHGYASSPQSSKAAYFKNQFAELGISVEIPDQNVPDFEHLTLTAMLATAADRVLAAPNMVTLIGSRMGGAVALHMLDRYPDAAKKVSNLILLAPALDFEANRKRHLGDDGLKAWETSGWLTVEHYGTKTTRQVHWGLMEDLRQYNSEVLDYPQPTLLIHGKQDESVDYQGSVAFAATRPNIDLHLLDADHTLLEVLPDIWTHIRKFLNL